MAMIYDSLHPSMAAKTTLISVIHAPTWKTVISFSFCFPKKINELLSQYDGYTCIFADGSKITETVGAAQPSWQLECVGNDYKSVSRTLTEYYCMVHQCTGSQLSHPLSVDILYRVHGLLSGGVSVVFMRVHSHVGLAGNSVVDVAAKAAFLLPVFKLTVPHSDYNSQGACN